MTEFSSAQERDSNHIETMPMTVLETTGLKTYRNETSASKRLDGEIENIVILSQPNQEYKVSCEKVNMPNGSTVGNHGDTANGNKCLPCVNHSPNRSSYQTGRMSLPLNGKYANNIHTKDRSKANGEHSNNTVETTEKSRLHRQKSENLCGCGSPLKQLFNHRDPEKPWNSKGDFFVAVLAYLLGIGNVVRFPQLFYKHGGGKENIIAVGHIN